MLKTYNYYRHMIQRADSVRALDILTDCASVDLSECDYFTIFELSVPIRRELVNSGKFSPVVPATLKSH